MINLLLKIYETFELNKDLFTDLGLEPVKHIDRYRGQPLNPEQFEYYDQPALFVGMTTTWTKSGRFYNGVLTLEFHVVTDPTWDTSNIATSNEEGLKNVMYHTIVRYILDGLESDNTGKMRRLDDAPVDTGVITYTVMRYECEYNDPMTSGRDYVDVLIEKLKIRTGLKKTLN